MNEIDNKIVLQALDFDVPVLTVSPQFTMTYEEWQMLYASIQIALKKVSDEVGGIPFITNVTNAIDGNSGKCQASDDCYHELVKFKNSVISECYICIHCGQIFRKSCRNQKDISKVLSKNSISDVSQHIIYPTDDDSKCGML